MSFSLPDDSDEAPLPNPAWGLAMIAGLVTLVLILSRCVQ